MPLAGLAVRCAVPPLQIIPSLSVEPELSVSLILADVKGTETVVDAVAEQCVLELVTVTEYEVVDVGLTVGAEDVPPGGLDHA